MNKKMCIFALLLGFIMIFLINPGIALADEGTTNISVDIVWKDNNNVHNTRPDFISMWLKVDGDNAYTSGSLDMNKTSFVFEDVSKGDGEREYNYELEVVGVSERLYTENIVKYGKDKFVVVYSLNTSVGENGEIIIPSNDFNEYADKNVQSENVIVDNNYLGQNTQEDSIVDESARLDDSPKTGDEFQYSLYICVAVIAFIVMIVLGIYILKSKKKAVMDVEEFNYVVDSNDNSKGITLTKDEDGAYSDSDTNSIRLTNDEENDV